MCPFSSFPSTSSSNDSTAEVTNAQPVSRRRGSSAACCLQVLDLDRDVVADAGELARQRLDDAQGVRRTVEEVGIAERDVLRARRDLRADVGEDDVGVDGAEAAVVDRDDRTVPAAVFAPARRLRVADDLPLVADLQRRVSATAAAGPSDRVG